MTPDPLECIRAGNEDALASLLEAEWPGLVRFLARRAPGPDAAEDLAQEAFVRLWERRERWRAGSARALLYRIGANLATDASRRALRGRRWLRAADGADRVGSSTPSEDLEAREAQARYRAALAELPERRREVFLLVREEGLGYRDIAEALGISEQTVANHMSMALRELRVALADLLPGVSSEADVGALKTHRPGRRGSHDG